ncbi:hypothetical protein [Mycobacterium sp. NPDC006124]|uniref:hypothetical protein n=1 Tax=Mycobacterium sp. NPDC006124 TaxID=3156729 RepID=UPI0033A9E21F
MAAGVVALGVVSGCTETSEGHPVANSPATRPATTSTSVTAPSAGTSAPKDYPAMGVTPTLREAVPPNALVCLPTPAAGTPVTVQVPDPSAPRIVLALPEGWTSAPSTTGLALTGPDGMSGAVDITETALDPAAAFEKYADDVSALAPISSVSVLPAENCGYSGQRLMGVLSGGPGGAQTYEDRIGHVWTDDGDYLVVIHVGAPQGSPAFDAATTTLTADFAITLP